MKVIYISGPIRGANTWELEKNCRRAEELALKVWGAGFAVICTHSGARFFQGTLPDNVWLDGDLELVSRCDGVLMTEDWTSSMGATLEHDFARSQGIPIYYSFAELNLVKR